MSSTTSARSHINPRPTLATEPSTPRPPRQVAEIVEQVRRAREEIGPGVELMADAAMGHAPELGWSSRGRVCH